MISKQGWINLYKPKNISSFKAINRIKKKFNINKIGHAGTLDPGAQGILPIAIGKATKLIPYISSQIKSYNFTISWGRQTTTDDSEGDTMFVSNKLPELDEIQIMIKNFIGEQKQIPPKISAVKIKGERAYKLARKNEEFTIYPKIVYVKSLEVISHNRAKTNFKIECGKGFYIRSFARDLAKDLKTFGHISFLEREKVGKFISDSSILLDDLLKIGQRLNEINCVIPTVSMLDDILALEILDPKDIKDLSFGRAIKVDLKYFESIDLDKKIIFLSNKGDIVSIGKLVGNLFKPSKILI